VARSADRATEPTEGLLSIGSQRRPSVAAGGTVRRPRHNREDLCKRLSPAERQEGLSPDDLLAALPLETREALARRLKDNGSPEKPG
jgi:hypothetical protein